MYAVIWFAHFRFAVANRTFTVDGKAHSFKLPSNLARGGYLLRHEIIGLHLANQPGGAEFYPSCIQINVGGSQSGAPSPNELVRFPGAYKDSDAGILVNAFGNAAYKFPGPAVSKLGSKSSNDVPADSDDVPTDSTDDSTPADSTDGDTPVDSTDDSTEADGADEDAGSPSSSSSPVPSSGTSKTKTPAEPSPSVAPPKKGSRDCKPAKKRATYDDSDDSTPSVPVPDDHKPRYISRVMARMVKHTH